MAAGALLLTQVSVNGTYFGDIFFGLLVFGPGVGFAFVTASIAALHGVPDHEAGLASGLSNTSFQIGAALGVAIVSTVSVTRTKDFLAANVACGQARRAHPRLPGRVPGKRHPRRPRARSRPSRCSGRRGDARDRASRLEPGRRPSEASP